jgi:hypothetical protein
MVLRDHANLFHIKMLRQTFDEGSFARRTSAHNTYQIRVFRVYIFQNVTNIPSIWRILKKARQKSTIEFV